MADRQVTLVVTNNCNLNCVYCYEIHNKRRMSLDTAKRIVLDEVHNAGGKSLEFDFFGGEPFLEFDLIKTCFGFIQEVCNETGIKYHCYATTNGTLVHGEIQRWLLNNCDNFSCGLSVDGTKYMTDINRCNSFDMIDLDFFAKNYSDQPIKMTLSPQTLPFLYEGVKFLHDKGFKISNNLAYGIDWNNAENLDILATQLQMLIDYYLANPDIEPCSLIGDSIAPLAYYNENALNAFDKHCGAGLNMVTYDTDGKAYPCQMFLPLSAGDKAKSMNEISFPEQISISNLNAECQGCVINSICSFCYGNNYNERGNIYYHNLQLCKYNKMIIKARAYFRAKQFLSNNLNMDNNEKQATLRSIKIIQEKLND